LYCPYCPKAMLLYDTKNSNYAITFGQLIFAFLFGLKFCVFNCIDFYL